MRLFLVCLFSVTLSCFSVLDAQIKWDGNFYEQAALLFQEKNGEVHAVYNGLTLLDLKLDSRPGEISRIRGELEFPFTHGSGSGFTGPLSVNSLNIALSPGPFKFTAGRFLPRWGVCRIFRPLDLFTPQTYFLNSLSFPGADGFSLKYYPSDLSSVEILLLPETEPGESRTALDAQVHAGKFDIGLMALYEGGDPQSVFGISLRGDLIIGIASELYFRTGAPSGFRNERDTWKWSFDLDWSFAGSFYVSAGYFYDESGVVFPENYPFLLASGTDRMTLGKQYLTADFHALTYQEAIIGTGLIMNLKDKSSVLYPYVLYEIVSHCFLGGGFYYFSGKSGTEFTLTGSSVLNAYLLVRF